MPTPSDATPKPERSYDDMVRQAEDAINEQNRAIEQRKADFEGLQQAVIPNRGVPPGAGGLSRRLTSRYCWRVPPA